MGCGRVRVAKQEDIASSNIYMEPRMTDRLPIADFIESRMQALGLTRGQLGRRCGYKNVAKSLRRIDRILGGATREAANRQMLATLRSALEADEVEFAAAVAATEARLDAAA